MKISDEIMVICWKPSRRILTVTNSGLYTPEFGIILV